MNTLELTSFRHCEAALKLPQLKQALYDDGAILMDRVLVTLHGKEHRARRMTEMRVFRRDFFRRYEQEVIPDVFAEVMQHVERDAVDLVDLGYRFMVYLALAFAGIDRQTHTQAELATLVDMLRMFGVAATLGQAKERDKAATTAAVKATLAEFDRQFFTPSVDRRRQLIEQVRGGTADAAILPMDVLTVLLTVLLQDEDQLDLRRDMVLRETAFYFLAGAHTSVHSLSHCVHHLMRWIDEHPQARMQFVADPVLVQRFVHESFRLHPSSPVSKRRALERVELPDGRIAQKNDIVIINLRQANRDAEIFGAGADGFDPYRTIARGVSETGITFGIGMHACLGKNLAAGSLPVLGRAVDTANHQFGTVSWIAHALLREGVIRRPDTEPELDEAIARETWLSYPVRFADA